MAQQILQVDSFTDTPFSGNPAGVCVLDGPRDDAWMQAVAEEMNLSETAFLYPRDGGYNLRWFTPVVEVNLCGHATLAAAHVLWTERHVERARPISFHTRAGMLIAMRRVGFISLNFPTRQVTASPAPSELIAALGVEPIFIGRNKEDYLIEVADEATLRSCEPDFDEVARHTVEGVIITTRGRVDYDFLSRYFAPRIGINEDPVTGAAHCALGPYWGEKLGKTTVTGYQASRRGGVVRVTLNDDRVILAGEAVTVIRGELLWSKQSRIFTGRDLS